MGLALLYHSLSLLHWLAAVGIFTRNLPLVIDLYFSSWFYQFIIIFFNSYLNAKNPLSNQPAAWYCRHHWSHCSIHFPGSQKTHCRRTSCHRFSCRKLSFCKKSMGLIWTWWVDARRQRWQAFESWNWVKNFCWFYRYSCTVPFSTWDSLFFSSKCYKINARRRDRWSGVLVSVSIRWWALSVLQIHVGE